MAESEHSNADAFETWLQAQEASDEPNTIEPNRGVQCWYVPIGTGGDEYARMLLDTVDGNLSVASGEAAYQFDMVLGPVQAKKLIEFLRTMPREPADDEKPEEVNHARSH